MRTIAAGLGWSHRELIALEHRERRWWAQFARTQAADAPGSGASR